MLAITNAFSSHLLNFPPRPDLNKAAQPNPTNAANNVLNMTVVPVVQTAQKYIPASFPTIIPAVSAAAAVPRQAHHHHNNQNLLSAQSSTTTSSSSNFAVQTSAISTTLAFASAVTAAAQSGGYESQYHHLTPGIVCTIPTTPQNADAINPAVFHGQHNAGCSPPSPHVNFGVFRQMGLKMAPVDDGYLYRGRNSAKPTGAGAAVVMRPSVANNNNDNSMCNFGYTATGNSNGFSPRITNCSFTQTIKTQQSLSTTEQTIASNNCENGQNTTLNSLQNDFMNRKEAIFLSDDRSKSSSPGGTSQQPTLALPKAVSSTRQLTPSDGSLPETGSSATPSPRGSWSPLAPNFPDGPNLQRNGLKSEPNCYRNAVSDCNSPEFNNTTKRKRLPSEIDNERLLEKAVKMEIDIKDDFDTEFNKGANGNNNDNMLDTVQKRDFIDTHETTSTEVVVDEESKRETEVKSLPHSIESILSLGKVMQDPLETKTQTEDVQETRIEVEQSLHHQDNHGTISNCNPNECRERVSERANDNYCESDDVSVISIGSDFADGENIDEKELIDIDYISSDEVSQHAHGAYDESVADNDDMSPAYDDDNDDVHSDSNSTHSTDDQLSPKASDAGIQTNDPDRHQNDIGESRNISPSHISEHLKRLQGLLTKEDVDHFQKDEFFQAKLQILRSVSKSCKITSRTDEYTPSQPLGPSGHIDTTNGYTLTAPCMPTLPPFQSILPASDVKDHINQWPTLGLPNQTSYRFLQPNQYHLPSQHPTREHHQTFPQTVVKQDSNNSQRRPPSDYLDDDSQQKSAFKPIAKKNSPSHFVPPHLAHLANAYTATGVLHKFPPRSHIPQPSSIALSTSSFHPSNGDGVKTNDAIPTTVPKDNNNHPLDDLANLDAISLLRFRSSGYHQCAASTSGSMPASFTYSSNGRPNPEAVNLWLAWLRARDPAALRNIPMQSVVHSALAKSSSPSAGAPPPRYHCGDCNKTYSTFGGLSKHRQFHCALHVKKEFACKICTKSYSSLGALKMHIRTHTLPCKCHICGKAFSRPWLLQGHVRTHTGEKPFRCNHCGRAFADRSNLRAHLQTHAEIKKYACVKCGKTFSRMSLLTKHSDGSCPANSTSCL